MRKAARNRTLGVEPGTTESANRHAAAKGIAIRSAVNASRQERWNSNRPPIAFAIGPVRTAAAKAGRAPARIHPSRNGRTETPKRSAPTAAEATTMRPTVIGGAGDRKRTWPRRTSAWGDFPELLPDTSPPNFLQDTAEGGSEPFLLRDRPRHQGVRTRAQQRPGLGGRADAPTDHDRYRDDRLDGLYEGYRDRGRSPGSSF